MAVRLVSRRPPVSVDVVVVACREQHLCVLVQPDASRRPRTVVLPWDQPAASEQLDAAASRIAKRACGRAPGWIEQAGAFGDDTAHPGNALISVCYVAVVPLANQESRWLNTHPAPALPERQRRMLSSAIGLIRSRTEHSPLAFSMLPREFTLSELQQTYETVLARRLHKASFRRSLQAAFLVEPTGEWRGEGRGRPAQLYRYAPRRRRGTRSGVRLDLL